MSIEQSIRITNPTGLHARPAVKLAQLAASFNANVQLCVDNSGDWIRAKSVAKVMKLKAANQATLHFRAEGEQAAAAVAALIDFVKRDFDEGPAARIAADAPELEVATAALTPVPVVADTPADGEIIISALLAAPGLADGALYRLQDHITAAQRRQGTPQQEQQALQNAIGQTLEQLGRLAQRGGKLGAGIIAFQQQLLADDELLEPVMNAIAAGEAAHTAWNRTLDGEIADYAVAANEYFRGRATDLRDLRDQVLAQLHGQYNNLSDAPAGAIIVADELTPSQFLQIDWTRFGGAVTRHGSGTGHVAMLARARQVPLLIQAQIDAAQIPAGAAAILSAKSGDSRLIVYPAAVTRQYYRERLDERRQAQQAALKYLDQPARSADGSRITLYINVDDPAVLDHVDPAHCDGIGLTRTEFLFYDKTELPDEESQYRVYRRLLEWAQGRPVTIRTLDAGGDKPITGLTPTAESNPFLGVRGLRLSLVRPDVFKVQLRALARAAVHGPLKVMLPMVSIAQELEQARTLQQQAVAELQQAGIAAAMPVFGMMVEVPAAALTIDMFNADFFSIGSNDLVQYVMAAGRDCAGVAALQNPLHPAVLELIRRVAEHAAGAGVEVSLCGEMAAQPDCLPALLSAGLTTLSVPAAALAEIKAALANISQQTLSAPA